MAREVCGICWCPYDEETGECECEPEPKAQHMNDLRTAAQQALEALEGKRYTACGWRADCDKAITALKAALAEPTPFEDVVTHGSAWSKDGKRIDPMSVYAEPAQEPFALPCPTPKACKAHCCSGQCIPRAALAEPVQKPVWGCPDSAEHRYGKPGHCEDCGKTLVQVAEPSQQGCDHCKHPLYAAIKCRVCGRVTPGGSDA